MKIVIDNKIPFIEGVFEPFAEVVYKRGAEITKLDVKDADALIVRTRTKCNADLLKGSKVRFIATATIGFDHIDAEFCKKEGIEWTNAKGCNSSSVLQYIFTALVAMEKKHGFQLKNKSIGIVGVGSVGEKIARYAMTLGMKVLLCDPFRILDQWEALYVPFSEIPKADIITFHVPLSTDGEHPTFHLADASFMDQLRQGTLLLNTSRGEVIDGKALKQALKNKKILDAVLDVWEHEPNIDLELLELIAIATPHIAGYSLDGKATGTAMSVHAVARFFGLPLENWEAADLPFIKEKEVQLNEGQTYSDVFAYTYNIYADDERLREKPDAFELQRESYPVRREFSAYRFQSINEEQKNMLGALGLD